MLAKVVHLIPRDTENPCSNNQEVAYLIQRINVLEMDSIKQRLEKLE